MFLQANERWIRSNYDYIFPTNKKLAIQYLNVANFLHVAGLRGWDTAPSRILFSDRISTSASSFQNSNRSQYSPCFFTYQNSEFSIPQYSVFNSSTTASTVGIMSAFYLINCSVYGNFCRCGRGSNHCLSYS